MAEQPDEIPQTEVENDEADTAENYKPPAVVTLHELRNKDAEDDSLARYKATLLGSAATSDDTIVFPNNPGRVVLTKLMLIANGRPDQELDLTQDKSVLKKTHLKIKEGTEYKIKTCFFVQREIVSGLKYEQRTYKAGIQVDKSTTMIGSFGPGKEQRECVTKPEEAPKGMIARGSYTVKSAFVDDDKNKYLEWEWSLDIVKEYKN